MTRILARRAPTVAVAALAVCSLSSRAQTLGSPEHFTAAAIDIDTGRTADLDINVDRWSTEAERDRLLETAYAKGSAKMLDVLQKLPKVGTIRNVTSLAWDLHYARHAPLPDGGEQIVIATDRPIGFWEAANQTQSLDYPFTVIELHINADGAGEGKMSVATKISVDKKTKMLVLEDWGLQPTTLGNVRRVKASH